MERILILGMTPLVEQLLVEVARRPACGAEIVGILDDVAPSMEVAPGITLSPLSRLRAVADDLKPDRIVVAFAERRGRMPARALLDAHISRGVIIEDVTEFYERFTGKLALEWLTPTHIIATRKFHPAPSHRVWARAISVLVAVMAIAITAPLLAVIAIAIKLDSRGPVFFAQRRVGLQGRPFTLWKFRTMHAGRRRSEWEGDNRDQVTRVGKWLRRCRIDELPQFANILLGDMNLVGPRPHPVTNLELLTLVARNLNEVAGAAFGCYALRLVIPPGLTGWAQVRYRYANNLDEEIEKLRYDLYYVKHMSLWLDLRIVAATAAAMVRGRGTTASEPATAKPLVAARPFAFSKVLTRLGLTLMLAAPAPLMAQDAPVKEGAGGEAAYEYVIGPADVLEVAVWQNALVSRTVPVRPDGRISLPVVNDIQAAGLTPLQLQSNLRRALADYIQAPEVSVIVREVHSFNVSVLGNVKTPGRYQLTSRVTVLDALALAGGLTEYADRDRLMILRRSGAATEQIPFAYDRVMAAIGSKSQSNFFIQPDDIILVR